MYFSKFPYTLYSLDDRKTVKVITNILRRVKIDDYVKNNLSLYDEYDIKDGDTPEILAFDLYGDSNLHWIILLMNEILDPRYDWPLDTVELNNYVLATWKNPDGVHHYEDSNGNQINGNVQISASNFDSYEVGDVIYNSSSTGKGYVTSKLSSSTIIVTCTEGGFVTNDIISNNLMGTNKLTVTSTTSITGTTVTNFIYENEKNESKRRIKILKPAYVAPLISSFDNSISQ